ncbi:glycerol-3-phosphate acyltransferase [bacterium]|nr:glycerol-3-phosphate acyltransferase [bacterium]
MVLTMVLGLISGYLIGSIPFGWVVVKLFTGKDVRGVESGCTGGTNAMRAAGPWAGLFTAVFDTLKGAAAVWIARALAPAEGLIAPLSGLMAILGHNYSLFLLEKGENGKLRLRGGAGGATTLGAAMGLWLPSLFVILPLVAVVYVVIGYASITTISIAITSLVLFALRAEMGLNPWDYALLGAGALVMVIIALRPNLQRLIAGTERKVNILARLKSKPRP